MGRRALLAMVVLQGACAPGASAVDATPPPGASAAAAASAPSRAPSAASPAEAPAAPAEEPEPSLPPQPELPSVASPTLIATASVWRESKTGKAPWKRVTVMDVQFGTAPKKGERVTVLPPDPSLPALELAITRVKKHPVFEDGDPVSWDAFFEPITDRAYFDVTGSNPQAPMDVVVVYPATPSATVLEPEGLSADDLPPSAPPRSVELAVDVDGDGKPDTVELTVCTDEPRQAKCGEATAWELHRRVDGAWTRVHRFEPVT